jgi:hypothetical protein
VRNHLPLFLLVAACSGGTKNPKQPETVPEPVATADAAPPSLAELCPRVVEKFRAEVKDQPPDEVAKVAEILGRHCAAWPRATVECLVTAVEENQNSCLDPLSEEQRVAFFGEIQNTMSPEGPSCKDVVFDIKDWAKVPDGIAASDVALVTAISQPPVSTSCQSAWEDATIKCVVEKAGPPRACLDQQADVAKSLGDDLAARDALFAAAAKYKATDKKIACKAVVEAHYGDKRWKNKMPTVAAKDRKKLIKASAAAMAAACAEEAWTPFLRGCVIAAKSEEQRNWCLQTDEYAGYWGYPAQSVAPKENPVGSTGIAACDQYVALVEKLMTCPKFPADGKAGMKESLDAMKQGITPAMPEDAKAATMDACKTAIGAIRDTAKTIDCKL